VHVLERGADVQQIVNMAAVAVIDAQQRSPTGAPPEMTATADGPVAETAGGLTPTALSRL
jgi:hypothetical protein